MSAIASTGLRVIADRIPDGLCQPDGFRTAIVNVIAMPRAIRASSAYSSGPSRRPIRSEDESLGSHLRLRPPRRLSC